MKTIWNRLDLAKYFNEQGYKIGLELGVFNGHYADVLLQSIPDLRLYLVDPWEVYPGYRDHKFKSSMDSAYESTLKIVEGKKAVIMRKYSVDAVKEFADNTLDFVFIDGNHEYKYVKEDIELWTPKVRPFGIVAGHDYYVTKAGNVGVVNAVNEYVKEHDYKLEILPWDLSMPLEDDRQPCWWFMK